MVTVLRRVFQIPLWRNVYRVSDYFRSMWFRKRHSIAHTRRICSTKALFDNIRDCISGSEQNGGMLHTKTAALQQFVYPKCVKRTLYPSCPL